MHVVTSASFQFTASSSEGAVLALPEGADGSDILSLELFESYARKNAESWYKYAKKRGRKIPPQGLFLVTGCDKVKSWGTAAYQQISRDFSIRFTALEVAGPHAEYDYRWDTCDEIGKRAVPSPPPRQPNQCV